MLVIVAAKDYNPRRFPVVDTWARIRRPIVSARDAWYRLDHRRFTHTKHVTPKGQRIGE